MQVAETYGIMERLLDPNSPFEIALLDEVIAAAYDPRHPQRAQANTVLVQLQELPEAWTHADAMIEQGQRVETKSFGLQILGDAIKTRWNILPTEQKEGIKNFIVGKLMSISQSEESLHANRLLVSRLNLVLVQILKREWPHQWPTFISDIVAASKTSESICENNMEILRLLSEEVFDFGRDELTSDKARTMREGLNEEFSEIFLLCDFVLQNAVRPSLLVATLQCLQRFLTWIPPGYVFETPLLQVLIQKFLPDYQFRNHTIDCLVEVAQTPDLQPPHQRTIVEMYGAFMQQLAGILSLETNFDIAYSQGAEEDILFLNKLALFFTTLFRNHLALLEDPTVLPVLQQGLMYLVKLSEVDDEEMFKVCLEFWHYFGQTLYASESAMAFSSSAGKLALGGAAPRRKQAYEESHILSRVRRAMISKMAKPEEVLVVEDENGRIIREASKDTAVIAQYKTMRETLVYLTNLNVDDTENIMLQLLDIQVDGDGFSWNGLNTLCWAVGSISGTMTETDEKRFLVTVIKDLLRLCDMKRGKDNKAVIASNIMYVVGQYPRFLRAHWNFLRTVVNKLFEFMHELHPGVQDMACDTFLKIAQKCKRKFMVRHDDKSEPFIITLIENMPSHISDLAPHQIEAFYEAVATMLSDKGQHVAVDRTQTLQLLMQLPNNAWQDYMNRARTNVSELFEVGVVRELSKILRTNRSVCRAAGSIFVHQLSAICLDMLNVYKVYSEQISQAVAAQGAVAARHTLFKAMRGVKSDILDLLKTFLDNTEEKTQASPQNVAQTLVPPILEAILPDYVDSLPEARDSQLLALLARMIEKLGHYVAHEVPRMMEAVFEPTLTMITQNFEDFPDHRLNFFKFLRAANNHCFEALFSIPPEHQKLVVDSIVWAFKHTERNVAETGLEILLELCEHMTKTPDVAQGFYQAFLLPLIQDILAVMTDRLHKSGFKLHVQILRHLFHLVESGQVIVPLFDPEAHPNYNNAQYVREYVGNLLLTSFPTLNQTQVVQFLDTVFDLRLDMNTFRDRVRDFLIQLKEFSVEDNSLLWSEEQRESQQRVEQERRAYQASVPGLLSPDDMNDL